MFIPTVYHESTIPWKRMPEKRPGDCRGVVSEVG